MILFKNFDWCKDYNLDKVSILLLDDYVTIYNSYKIKKTSHMFDVIKWIKQYNKPVTKQNTKILLVEWKSHNLLYWLNIKRDRTIHCDINVNTWWEKIIYFILSLFYFGQ